MTDDTSTDLPAAWCRTWTDDARQWSGNVPGLDSLVGPVPSASLVATRREGTGPRFTPRLVVCDGAERLACTWDVAAPDGAVRTGIALDVLRDGRVAENWTVVGERRAAAQAVDEGEPTDRSTVLELCDRWILIRDGDIDSATDLLADDVGIWFGAAGDLRGREAFAAFVDRRRAGRPSLRSTVHRDPAVDVGRGRAAFTWTAAAGMGVKRRCVGGIDVLTVRSGRIAQVWSITGSRPFTS